MKTIKVKILTIIFNEYLIYVYENFILILSFIRNIELKNIVKLGRI